ncbi:MAG: type I-B CRISPR-associated protein Cas8b1/Cst1 [Oscillospiraceae bacterium]|nr:type I-B CRISPR-associated protein Cas8b1/Cst1 [Oscillospiraceae bacterium]
MSDVERSEEEVYLYANDALYNAGLLGCARVLDRMEQTDEHCYYRTGENGCSIYVQPEAFSEKFTKAYFEKLIEQYGNDTVYKNLMDELAYITSENARQSENYTKKLSSCISLLYAKLKRNSYQAGFEILKTHYGINYDFLATAKSIKNEADPQKQLSKLKEIDEQLKNKDVRYVLLLKDIIYTRVQEYWTGVSFLHKQKNKEPFEQAFNDYFLDAIQKYKTKKGKKSIDCFQCGRTLQSGASSTAWVNETVPDVKRKTDSFWNYKPDIMMCPYCMLVYACVPLGFSTFAHEGVFVNDCRSIKALKSANNFKDVSEELKDDPFAVVINRFTLTAEEKEAKNQVQNIQVVRCSNAHYTVNNLTADMLIAFQNLNLTFEKLLKANSHLFHRTLERVLNNQELYGMMLSGYRESLKNGYGFGIYSWVLDIQIEMFGRNKDKETVRMEKSYKWTAYKAGQALRKTVQAVNPNSGKTRANEKRLVGVTYRLLNALQSDDYKLFMDTMTRQYISLGLTIPKVFCNAIQDTELFPVIGHAFIQGLNSSAKPEENSKTDTNTENESEDK